MEYYSDEQLRTFKNEKLLEIINVYGEKTEFLKMEADKALLNSANSKQKDPSSKIAN